MDQELLDLLARLQSDDNPLTDDELGDLRGRIATILGEVDRTAPTDEDLAVLSEGVEYLRAIDTEVGTRSEAAAGRAAQAEALLEGIELPVAEQPEPEPEPEPAPEAEPTSEPEPAPEEAQTLEPVAAAAVPEAPRLPRISHLAHRSPRQHRPVPTATDTATVDRPRLIASGSMPGITPGQPVDLGDWGRGVAELWNSVRNIGPSDGEQMIRLGQIRKEYPDAWFLDKDENRNEEKLVAAAADPEALGGSLTASGGICGPVQADYNVTTIASADRPVRDGLNQFGASRGGVRFVLPHTLSQVHTDAPAAIWTQATDAAPGGSTKGRATYVCQGVTEKYVDSIVSRVKFGNFQARFFAEQTDQYMATVEAEHARLAEGTLLGQMLTGSTLVTGALNIMGAAADFFAHVDLAAAGYRWRHRMRADAPLQLFYPEWLEDELRADLARELPGNSGGQSERLAVADAQLDAMFAVRSLQTVKFLDNPTGANPAQSWVVQGAGPLLPWPTKVLSFLFHPGAWDFLDGGELNLGMVRDSTLNNTNDFEMFSETFELAVFRGHESIALMLDLCPSGARAGTVDASALCTSGS